jgi:hypothetical protein
MRVILHLGAHRTASTTLQKTLGANSARLGDAGIAYWGPRRTRGGLFDGLIGPSSTRDAGAQGKAMRRVSRRLADAEAAGTRILFVSEENALGTMRHALASGVPYADACRRVGPVAAAFAGRDITLALAIRALDDWWASVAAYGARRGFAQAPAEPGLRGWRAVIRDIAAAVPGARIVVWTYEAMAARPGAVVARLTGRDGLALEPAAPRNVTRRPAPDPLTPDARQRLRRTHEADLAWLAAGADGVAELIDEGPEPTLRALAGQ